MTQPPQGGPFPPPSGPPFGGGQPDAPYPDAPYPGAASPYGPPGQPGGAPGYPPPPGYGTPVPPPVSGAPMQPGGFAAPSPGYPAPAGGPYPAGGYPAAGYPPGYPAPVAPKKKRGLLIASIVLVVALLLCGGGGAAAFFLLRDTGSGEGAAEPTTAVQEFLTAVYQDRNAARATELVCSSSRDREKITAKVDEVKKYVAEHETPRFRWTAPKEDERTDERATVSTKVTMTTADEKVAEQELRFTVVRDTGWWVCEVR